MQLSALPPRNLNLTQRYGLFAAMLVLLGLVVIHNPIDGYTTGYSYATPGQPMPKGMLPPDTDKINTKLSQEEFDALWKQYSDYATAYNASLPQSHWVEYSFLDWDSDGAFLAAVGPIKNFLMFAVSIVLATGLWIWLFASRDQDRRSTS